MKKKTRPEKHLPAELWLCLGLGLLILIFYANSFSAGLLFDSEVIIKDDPRLRGLSWVNLQNIFTRNYWWPTDESILYRPLTTLTYLFNYSILQNGESAGGYHVMNFLLHWANAWFVLLIVRRLAGRLDLAVLTASLFAIHPLNTEAVTNVVGRADLLATLCVLFGSWCYLRAALPGTQKRRWLVLMGLAACAGVLAKENAVMIVGFVVLYDFCWRLPLPKNGNSLDRLKRLAEEFWQGYASLIPGLLLIWITRRWVMSTTMVFEEFFLDNPIVGAAPFQRFMTAIGVIGRYLKLLVFPRSLSSDYSFNQIPPYGTGNSGSEMIAWISLAVIVLLLSVAICVRVRQKLFFWGVLFFFIMLLPTSNLVITIGSIMAERFLYLPSIGFCACAAVVLCGISEKLRLRWALPIIVIGGLGIRTFVRNSDWQDNLGLWKSTVAASPGSYKAHMIYGDEILGDAQHTNHLLESDIDEAIAQEEIARSILEPEPPLPLKWQNLTPYLHLAEYYRMKGQFLEDGGRHDDGLQFYQKSVAALTKAQEIDRFTNQASREFRLRRGIAPQDIPDIGNVVVYESLCLTYAKLQQWEKCVAAARYLQHIAPYQAEGYQLAGAASFNLGHYAEAAVQFLAGLLIDPDNVVWWTGLSSAYENLGVQPNPVLSQGASFRLNRDSALVHEQLNEAAVIVVQLLEEAKKPDEAREVRDRIIKQYSLPLELFVRKS